MVLGACSLWLAASRPMLAACSGKPEAWSLQLLAVDRDPGTEALPVVAHNLELSGDGLQLARARV